MSQGATESRGATEPRGAGQASPGPRPGPDLDLQRIAELQRQAEAAVAAAADLAELERLRVEWLGKKGRISLLLRQMGSVPPDLRPAFGQRANAAREAVEAALARRRQELEAQQEQRRLAAERVDVTLPGRPVLRGRRHPLRRVELEIIEIFRGLGFTVAEGPEVERDYYNFEALNIPPDHPARDMHDTFYLTGDILLRTHTSPVQVRYMLAKAPELPVRIIAPGRVYRRDDDATHSPMFHQVEGLLVDRGVSFAHLKGTLAEFARRMFGPDTRYRFRPSYFPFTEPSAEMDVSCPLCGGSGCRTCGGSGWIEILGSGLVHPKVLQAGGYDPEEVSGFAFGMGIERIAMIKYDIDDMRLFFQNDLRFLAQFR
ncbi:phenylalanyl-tRNA synthetase, alpha subunit [Thermaerobacter marianensis DSM 12885]|uniref:Phenylalanine--tRNA ligase alpha subunit n=1 Tax=Thermaerobacter marianensis (strain ATCC 700841 / DSM 12885 / JCM 10246 / 7p75a) TaxID=644966 RepID=E6SIV5_THEM7|nr:phenylalanyl-tRNA synthetase, alpha subunit [Thermaerobacter marianensis DSM 12885]